MTSTRHFQLGSCSGARSEQNVPTHCIVNREPAPHNTYRIPYIASNLPSFFIDGSNWTIGDYSPTQSRKYAFVIVILIVLGKKKRRPCLLPLNYRFNEENDNGKPQEKTRIRDSCEIALYRIPHRKRQERQKTMCWSTARPLMLTMTGQLHARANERRTKRTNVRIKNGKRNHLITIPELQQASKGRNNL